MFGHTDQRWELQRNERTRLTIIQYSEQMCSTVGCIEQIHLDSGLQ